MSEFVITEALCQRSSLAFMCSLKLHEFPRSCSTVVLTLPHLVELSNEGWLLYCPSQQPQSAPYPLCQC